MVRGLVTAQRPGHALRPSALARFTDPDTELIVTRLTDPAVASTLPAFQNRSVSARSRVLMFASEVNGQWMPFQLDLRSGVQKQLAAPALLRRESLSLDNKDRTLYFLDGSSLQALPLGSAKERAVIPDVTAYSLAAGTGQIFYVRNGHLQCQSRTGEEILLAEETEGWCLARPNGQGCLFCRNTNSDSTEFWYSPLVSGTRGKPKLLASGAISNPVWKPDGTTLLFLQTEQKDPFRSIINEVVPETGVIEFVSKTSQFAAFAPNGDGSVFVGASRSKAQPTVVLLVRSAHRELTLCEHRSKNAAFVQPIFSPTSQRVYFQSDRDGKPALYSVNVERLVEPTT